MGPGPAPGAGGRHGSWALVWLLYPSQPRSPSPQSPGQRTWDLQPQAPPGGLTVLQANPAEQVETARLPRAKREGAEPSAGGRKN